MITKIEESGQASYGLTSFICDDENDIIELEENAESVPAGSMALIIDSGTVMIRRHNKSSTGKYWQEFTADIKGGGSGGSGSDPIVENAKQTGGFGYTEQGEQTVITWDGDTEGRDSFTLNFGLGEVSYYKVSEKSDNYTDSAVVGFADTGEREAVKSDGNGAFMYWDGESILVVVADGGEFSLYNGVITGDAPSAGVYFMNFAQAEVVVSSLTYGTPDTVHKVDEKYLPEAGGGGIFEIFYNSGTTTVDKTYSDIKQAYYAGKNVTLRIAGDVILHVSMMPMPDDDLDDAIVFSGLADIYIDADAAELQSANVYQVAISSDESVTFEQGYFGF